MTASTSDVVSTTVGSLRGTVVGGVAAFRGIPYAEPPIGELRLASPVPIRAWEGVRSAERQAVAPPQEVPDGVGQTGPRGQDAMGPMDVPGYSEDCLTLNVWTPEPRPGADLPVFVWFHGGGFVQGAGSAGWYDGSVLAERGRIVVVTVNYRLGALGYLYLPPGWRGRPAANLGLQDQCTALEWVRDNISAFGGDPDKVTVAGQSAGGLSITGLCAMPRARGLFRRAAVHSSGPAQPANSTARAEEFTRLFLAEAGVEEDGLERLLHLSVDEIITAQHRTMFEVATRSGMNPLLRPPLHIPFQLVVDGQILPEDPAAAAMRGSMDSIDLLIMCASEEMNFALAGVDAFWQQPREAVVAQLDAVWGPQRVALYEKYAAARPEWSPAEILAALITDENCVLPNLLLAERRAKLGNPAYFAWFTWRSPAVQGRLGACHTVELPFVFNNLSNWSRAPMVAEADPAAVAGLAVTVQDAWVDFIAEGTAPWPAFTESERLAMEFGTDVTVIDDPAGERRNAWRELGLDYSWLPEDLRAGLQGGRRPTGREV